MMQIDTILELCEDIRLKGRHRHRQKRSLEAQADAFLRLKILWDSLLRIGLKNTHRAVLLHHVLQNEFSKQVQTCNPRSIKMSYYLMYCKL